MYIILVISKEVDFVDLYKYLLIYFKAMKNSTHMIDGEWLSDGIVFLAVNDYIFKNDIQYWRWHDKIGNELVDPLVYMGLLCKKNDKGDILYAIKSSPSVIRYGTQQ